jgi:hypothetical protein
MRAAGFWRRLSFYQRMRGGASLRGDSYPHPDPPPIRGRGKKERDLSLPAVQGREKKERGLIPSPESGEG